MAKPRIDKVVKGNVIWHEHGGEDVPDAALIDGSRNFTDDVTIEGALNTHDRVNIDVTNLPIHNQAIRIFNTLGAEVLAGTASTMDGDNWTGSGTSWMTDLAAGRTIYIESLGADYTVSAVFSDTSALIITGTGFPAGPTTFSTYTAEQDIFTINKSGDISVSLIPNTTSVLTVGSASRRYNAGYINRLYDGTGDVSPSEAENAYDHISSTGASHTYIDQDVTTTASPTFISPEVDSIIFDTDYSVNGSEVQGETYWDSDNGTLSTVLGNGVVGQHFKEAFIDGQNDTGSSINNGTPVQYAGSIGNSGNFRISPALAQSSTPSFYFVGVLTETVANGAIGKITTRGKVRGIQTDGTNYGESWSAGDIIYVSGSTAGYLTKTPPSAPTPAIPVALVISAHASNGTLEVRPDFPTKIGALSDVNGTTPDATNKLLVWDNSNSYWDASPESSIDHGNLSGLSDDDHPQYLLADGTRAMSADLNMGGYDVVGETKCTDVTIAHPYDYYALDTQLPIMYVKSALTVTKIVVTTNSSSYNVAGDLKWADSMISLANATVINAFDTSGGVLSDDTITAGSVAAGKWIYLQFDSQPNTAVTFMTVHVEWDYD